MEERIFRLKDSQEIQFDKFPQCPKDRDLCLWEKTVLLERWEQALETRWLPLAEGWALITSEGSQVQILRENERTELLWCTTERRAEYTAIFSCFVFTRVEEKERGGAEGEGGRWKRNELGKKGGRRTLLVWLKNGRHPSIKVSYEILLSAQKPARGQVCASGTLIVNPIGKNPRDIFPVVQIPGNKEFDMNFRAAEKLNLLWRMSASGESKKQGWKKFVLIALARHS